MEMVMGLAVRRKDVCDHANERLPRLVQACRGGCRGAPRGGGFWALISPKPDIHVLWLPTRMPSRGILSLSPNPNPSLYGRRPMDPHDQSRI